jgi:integrase
MREDGVFVRKDRKGFFISWMDQHGRRRRRKTAARTLLQARNALSAEKMRVEKAKILGFTPPGKETFTEAADRFLDFQKARVSEKEHAREESIFRNHLKPYFPASLASINKSDIDRYVTMRCGKVSPSTVRREATILKYMLRKAVDWEIIPLNPALGVEAPPAAPGRVRYLQPTEFRALLNECPDWLCPIVELAVFTGMRRGEILSLHYLNIDLSHGCILLPQTKNGEGRILPLNKSAMQVLASLPPGKPTNLLFPDIKPDKVTVAFKRACRRAGIQDFRFHDLRHTTGSWLAMSGKDIYTIAKILGHKDLRMSARYAHLSNQYLGEAVRSLDGVFSKTSKLSPHSVPSRIGLIEGKSVND